MAKKRQTSAKTRVKLSQAAKRRHRAPSGSAYGGQFLAGLAPSLGISRSPKRYREPSAEPKFARPTPMKTRQERSTSETRELAQIFKEQEAEKLKRAGVSSGITRERMAREHTYFKTKSITGEGPTIDDMAGGPVTVRMQTKRDVNRRLADTNWQSGQSVYGQTWKDEGRKGPLTPSEFIDKELAPSHKQWLDQALADPNSPFNKGIDPETTTRTRGRTQTPGARRRLEKYTQSLQQGKSHNEALDDATADNRGRSPSKDFSGPSSKVSSQQVKQSRNRPEGHKDPYSSMQLKPDEFSFGVSAATPRPIEKLKETFPGLTDQEYVRIRETDRISMGEEILKNAKWAHETQRAQIQTGKTGKADAAPDRVTFFTTNLGGPELSIPTDSLVGQYIIQRRKTMMVKEGSATKGGVKGEFPRAIRDQHLIEIKAMGGASVQGRFGIVQESGVRAGGWQTRGFGKRAPVGAAVLTDSSGRPIYDSSGNIRYSSGTSRGYDIGTDKVTGLRIFVG